LVSVTSFIKALGSGFVLDDIDSESDETDEEDTLIDVAFITS